MPAPSPPRAEGDALLSDLRAAAGCVTRTLLVPSPDHYNPARIHSIAFAHDGDPVPLFDHATSGRSGLLLHVRHQYEIIANTGSAPDRGWHVVATASAYRLLDSEPRELLVFHWQSGVAAAGPDHPHHHISASLTARVTTQETREIPLDKLHVPTGRISFTSVIRMLIEEFRVKPLHADWKRRLDRSERDL